jgi:hypothetical protein
LRRRTLGSAVDPWRGPCLSEETEIEREQQHVDRVYTRLDVVRAEAERSRREGFQLVHARTPGSLVERDAMVLPRGARLRALDAEYEGLVFGRLTCATARCATSAGSACATRTTSRW